MHDIILWARTQNNLGFQNINEKNSEVFLNGSFNKLSRDLLQLVCGHRTEMMQIRRDNILNYVRDPLVKSTLRKILPSSYNLFNAEQFSTALEKAGGVKKAFLPSPSAKVSVSKVCYNTNRHPTGATQGATYYNKTSRSYVDQPMLSNNFAYNHN